MAPNGVGCAQEAYGALAFIFSLEKLTIFEILANWPPGGGQFAKTAVGVWTAGMC